MAPLPVIYQWFNYPTGSQIEDGKHQLMDDKPPLIQGQSHVTFLILGRSSVFEMSNAAQLKLGTQVTRGNY